MKVLSINTQVIYEKGTYQYNIYYNQVLFSILLTRWTNNYPKEECAKFGYKSNMKVYIYMFFKFYFVLTTSKNSLFKYGNF